MQLIMIEIICISGLAKWSAMDKDIVSRLTSVVLEKYIEKERGRGRGRGVQRRWV